MKRDTVNYTLVGAFVVAMAVAFVVLLMAVTGRGGPSDTYFVYYENVAGLKFGTGVYYEGYQVGQVEGIEPETTAEGMRYRVTLSITAGWRIPADSVARVAASGLISAVTIEIAEGGADTMLEPGAIIEGQGKADLVAVLNQAAGDFRVLSQEGILPVLDNLNQSITMISQEFLAFRRDELGPFVHMIHERLEQDILSEAQVLLAHLDESAQAINAIVADENRDRVRDFLVHLDEVALNLNALIARIEDTRVEMNGVLAGLGGMVGDNRATIKNTVRAADESMMELEQAMRTINQHLGTIMYDVEGSARNMNEFARGLRENPARLLRQAPATEPGAP
ncbi:MAG: MlaD family protein [Gammaproteobacteria bacterium]